MTAKSLVLSNRGGIGLQIQSIAITGDFVGSNDCGVSLAPGSTCRINVEFVPKVRGTRIGAVTITADAPGGPFSTTLRGTGIAPVVSLSLMAVAFGNQIAGTTSTARTLNVRNVGDGPLEVAALDATEGFAGIPDTCGFPVSPGATCRVSITFTPPSTGAITGSMRILVKGSSAETIVSLSGTGLPVGVDPPFLSFGSQAIGQVFSKSTSLWNQSAAPLGISGIAITGDGFSQTNNCPASLPAGVRCVITVSFAPTAAQSYSGALTVTDDGPGNPHVTTLSGRGGTPGAALSTASLAFETLPVGVEGGDEFLRVANPGTSELTVSAVTASGDFTVTSFCGVVQPGASCAVAVRFRPTRAGSHSGALQVNHNAGGPLSADLSGVGVSTAPAPAITSMTPNSVIAGSGGFTLRVFGSGFYPNSVVRLNDRALPTTFFSRTLVWASVSPADVSVFGTADVSVSNSPGNVLSNAQVFAIYDALPIHAKDLAYDPFSRRIYASVAGAAAVFPNTIAPLDPFTGTIEQPVVIGNDPGKLALSDNGGVLFAGLDGSGAVRSFELQSRTPGAEFSLGSNPYGGITRVGDMRVLPGSISRVVISRASSRVSGRVGTVIYDNGVKLNGESPDGSGALAVSADPGIVYDYNNQSTEWGLRVLAVDATGLRVVKVLRGVVTGFGANAQFADGWIYTASGAVGDPSAERAVGRYPIGGESISVAPDTGLGLTFFLLRNSDTAQLLAFDQLRFVLVGSIEFPDVFQGSSLASPNVGSLIRWGEDGLAFRTSTNQVMLVKIPPAWKPSRTGTYAVSDRGGVSFASTGASPGLSVGYARIEPAAGAAAPFGIAIFGFKPGAYLVGETGVPAVKPLRSGRLYAELGAGVNTGVAIANPSPTLPSTITFTYTDSAGANRGVAVATLAPFEHIARFIDAEPLTAFSDTVFRGTLSISASSPVVAMALRGYTNERGDFLMSTLPVLDTSAAPVTGPTTAPHFADGAGWTTQLVLVNPTDSPLAGNVEFRDDSGVLVSVSTAQSSGNTHAYQVAARSAHVLVTSGASPAVNAGSVRILPSSGAAPVAQAVFAYKPTNVVLAQAGAQALSSRAFRAYVESAGVSGSPGNIQSGIAIANTEAAPVTVTLELTALDGAPVGASAIMSLPAYGHRSAFLSQFFNVPATFSGILRISAATPIAVVGLRARYNELSDFLITTTPPADETAAAGFSELYLPQLADGGGYTTQFILFSAGPGQEPSGVLRLTNSDGSPLNLEFR